MLAGEVAVLDDEAEAPRPEQNFYVTNNIVRLVCCLAIVLTAYLVVAKLRV